jgi:DICT domain-containing protein
VPEVFRKTTLQALTRAVEDECCARAEQAAMFAAFQRQRFYLQSQDRWNEIARTARVVVAFADLRRAMGLLNRMTTYIEKATPRG